MYICQNTYGITSQFFYGNQTSYESAYIITVQSGKVFVNITHDCSVT